MQTSTTPFVYRCLVHRVVDGDTVVADVDLGFGIWMRDVTFRMYGINAPEMKGASRESGITSRVRLAEMFGFKDSLLGCCDCIVVTRKDKREKYGRMLGEFYVAGDSASVNSGMVACGYAVSYMSDSV